VGLHPAVLEGTIRPQGALDHCGLQEGETEPKPKHWSARTTHFAIVTACGIRLAGRDFGNWIGWPYYLLFVIRYC